jgi:hypothetical protein
MADSTPATHALLRERLLKAYSGRLDNSVAVLDAPDLYEVIGILQDLEASSSEKQERDLGFCEDCGMYVVSPQPNAAPQAQSSNGDPTSAISGGSTPSTPAAAAPSNGDYSASDKNALTPTGNPLTEERIEEWRKFLLNDVGLAFGHSSPVGANVLCDMAKAALRFERENTRLNLELANALDLASESAASSRHRTCCVCGVSDIPFGVDWPTWKDGKPCHALCYYADALSPREASSSAELAPDEPANRAWSAMSMQERSAYNQGFAQKERIVEAMARELTEMTTERDTLADQLANREYDAELAPPFEPEDEAPEGPADPLPTEGFYEKLWKDFVSLQRGDTVGICAKVERYYREQASASHERSNDPRLLVDLSVALDDWLHQYAPEHCHEDQVRERAKRIFDMGGTLYYLAGLQKRIRAAIASSSAKPAIDDCHDCGRGKAHSANDCAAGLCPKWYAIRDPDADDDCKRVAKANSRRHDGTGAKS